jgi:cytochrome bd-type quinol oxidase subunit 1
VNDALFLHRIHFAFTITFHYLFPQLTMGLAPLIVVLKTLAIRTGNEAYNESVRFWTKIFGINFALGGWDTAYNKENFYRGIRILLELQRNGSSKL